MMPAADVDEFRFANSPRMSGFARNLDPTGLLGDSKGEV
jgi:hypothetical protein